MEVETAATVEVDETAENCEELDDDFFNEIGQTFDVVDAWDDGEDETASNSQLPTTQIKQEPKDAEKSPIKKYGKSTKDSKETKSSRVRTESDRSDSKNRDPRSRPSERDKENDKKSKSPERRRPSRFSPPGRAARRSPPPRPPFRRNSPPRRNSQVNNARPSFLEDMVSQFPDIRNDLMNPNSGPVQYTNNASNNFYGMMQAQQIAMQQNFMGQPGFMPQQQFPQQIVVDAFGQPFQQFPNPLMNPMMAPGTIVPMPVPAPIEAPPPPVLRTPLNAQDPRLKSQQSIAEQLKKAANRDIDLQQAKAKAFANGKIGLTDFLKQVSHQSSKKASTAEISAKKLKVHERCKEAAKMIDEIGANKVRLPFTFRPSEKLVATMKSDPKMGMRSPLTMNDNNMLFLSQAKIANCRDAIQANPMRNISGGLFQLCRNAGLDLVDLSQKVQRKVEVEYEKEMRLTQGVDISTNVVDPTKKKIQRSSQTDLYTCLICEERVKQNEEPGNFNVKLTAQAINNLSRDQRQALAELCRVFDIADDRFKPAQPRSQWESDDEDPRPPLTQRENDERMTYANPENPNMDDDKGFITFSPLRRSRSRSPIRQSRSPIRRSRSPNRRRITDRLGAKIPSPLRPARFRDDEERMLNPTAPYRIPTPPLHLERSYSRLSPPSGYRTRTKSRSHSPRPVRYREKRSRTPERTQRRGRY